MTLEALFARVYVDPEFRRMFLADPVGAARRVGLAEAMARDLGKLDRAGIEMQAASFAAKRRDTGNR